MANRDEAVGYKQNARKENDSNRKFAKTFKNHSSNDSNVHNIDCVLSI
jgi:hypothetical protein